METIYNIEKDAQYYENHHYDLVTNILESALYEEKTNKEHDALKLEYLKSELLRKGYLDIKLGNMNQELRCTSLGKVLKFEMESLHNCREIDRIKSLQKDV